MVRYFLFLKLLDPEVCSFLWELREIFGREKKLSTSIHVTVRGPNKGEFARDVIEHLYRKIADDTIVIQSAGRFDNGQQQVVYIKVSSANLRKIWRKPDYPKGEFGINPHITLYSGSDREYANRIYEFMKKENVALICNSFELIPYQTKQKSISGIDEDLELIGEGFEKLIDRGRLSVNVLERAKQVVSDYETEKRGRNEPPPV